MNFDPSPLIQSTTIRRAWPLALRSIVAQGHLRGPTVDQRGDKTFEILGLQVRLTDPLNGMIPDLPKMPGVTAWGDKARLDDYFDTEIMSIDRKGFDYVYGEWLVPGLLYALDILEKDPSTRRVFIPVGAVDDFKNPNPACLRGVWLVIRGPYLHQFDLFRSHDYAGAAATNWYGLIRYQALAAQELGLRVGVHVCDSRSAHIRIGKADNPNDHGDLNWVEAVLR